MPAAAAAREQEADGVDEERVDDEQPERGEREEPAGRRGTAEERRGHRDAGHRRGPQHRRLPARHRAEQHEDREPDRQAGSRAAAAAATDRRSRGRTRRWRHSPPAGGSSPRRGSRRRDPRGAPGCRRAGSRRARARSVAGSAAPPRRTAARAVFASRPSGERGGPKSTSSLDLDPCRRVPPAVAGIEAGQRLHRPPDRHVVSRGQHPEPGGDLSPADQQHRPTAGGSAIDPAEPERAPGPRTAARTGSSTSVPSTSARVAQLDRGAQRRFLQTVERPLHHRAAEQRARDERDGEPAPPAPSQPDNEERRRPGAARRWRRRDPATHRSRMPTTSAASAATGPKRITPRPDP